MPRRLAEPAFRAAQEADRYAAHVRPIDQLVDSLRDETRGWMPHVAPLHGGIDAEVLSVLRDPGPATQVGSGLAKRYPARARRAGTVIATFHPGRQALFHPDPDPDVRRARAEHREAAYRELAGHLGRA